MIIVISPAKTLDYTKSTLQATDTPKFRKHANQLIEILKTKSPEDLKKLMSISDQLAELNYRRFQKFSSRYTDNNSKASIMAFKGDVYLGLEAETLQIEDITFAQKHLRILSGLYGLLKPLDKMQPYRLEMGTTLANEKGNNLYIFWGDQITKAINRDLASQEEKVLVNLASNEYFKSIHTKKIKAKILDISFKEFRNGTLSFISFNAKKARGLMSRYIIQNKITKVDDIKGFNLDNYYFDEENSTEDNFLFVR